MLLHGITYGGHPVAAAIALRNIEIFEREGVLENVRAHEAYLGDRLESSRTACRSSATCAARATSGRSSWSATRPTPLQRRRARAAAARLPHRRLLEEGLIARPDDRGDAVLHLAPPLVAASASSTRWSRRPRRCWPTPRSASSSAGRARRSRLVAGGGGTVAPAAGAARGPAADVVIVGGGYTGLWTAWQLLRARRERRAARGRRLRPRPERAQRRLRRDAVDQPPRPRRALRGRAGARRARASAESVAAIGAWCEAQGVDAWFTPRGFLLASRLRPRTRCSTGGLDGGPGDRLDGAARPARPRRRCASAAPRRCSAAPSSRPATRRCTRRGWRSGCASA